MRETIERRGLRFAEDLGVEVEKIVVDALDLPTRPQKDSTHRREDDDTEAAELDAVDALHPGLLGDWLAEAVEPWCPEESRALVHTQEERDCAVMAGLAADPAEDDSDEE